MKLDKMPKPDVGGAWLAVIGHPISHSLSPAMHNAALGAMAKTEPRFANWECFSFDIPPEDFTRATLAKFAAAGFKGLNLTMPHKVKVLELVKSSTQDVKAIGAANTVLLKDDGCFHLENTDMSGLQDGISRSLKTDIYGKNIVLLGAGGAARAAVICCLNRQVASLTVINRSVENLDALESQIQSSPYTRNKIPRTYLQSTQASAKTLPKNALVINATSVGMDGVSSPFDLSKLQNPIGVYDMIYNPPETPLLKQAKGLGIPFANGLSMLVYQGARSLSLWTGKPVDPKAMFTALA